MKKDIPLISQLLKAIIVDNYALAIDIITREDFDPNETNDSWKAPVLTAVVNVLSTTCKDKDMAAIKEILQRIADNENFDPNIVDAEGETVLMHIARHEDFNWLVPIILNTGKVDLSIKNFMHHDVLHIAEKSHNTVMLNSLLSLKHQQQYKSLPKKRVGIKNKKTTAIILNLKNCNIIKKIESAFRPEQKKKPASLYNLLMSFFREEYDTCIQIVRDPNFDPNEADLWEEPALSSFIYYSQDSKVEYDEEMFRKIVEIIISNKKFDVNAIDSECNTVLMVAMGFPNLKWLAEMLFNIQSARIDIINDSGESIRQIAEKCGNGSFYSHLIRKACETYYSN